MTANCHPINTRDQIIALERSALTRWGQGDPSGFLEICAADVVYFDPFLPARLNGLPALAHYYEALRGKVRVARDEMREPLVQLVGEAAVLSFDYTSYDHAGAVSCWHCTEVYRQAGDAWRIIQTHWSLAANDPT
jgi:hypothetical protein